MCAQLSWSHYRELLKFKDLNKVDFYIYLTIKYNLSVRELIFKIKSEEYERLNNKTKEKLIIKEENKVSDFIKNEFKIKLGDRYNYIDLLLFNYMYNCFVVIELKVTELKSEHIGQIEKYINYIDKNVRTINQDKTIGIIICKKDNQFVMEYCSDNSIFKTTYKMI